MRVAEAVTATRSTSLWIMFGLVVAVYVFVFGSFLVILLKMRSRWRQADRTGGPEAPKETPETDTPETDTPYGPRSAGSRP